MKVGDLVKYQDWWAGEHQKEALGLILALPIDPDRDLSEQDYRVFWFKGNYTGEYGCMGKYLEAIK